ncbi:hypothetical protein GGR57DRAFT_44363 [Xylariaceae sp. FL1272]|nr:hypothetical protein GGR57DRAFT_44363 [Xylariaceae sp. FL1272]
MPVFGNNTALFIVKFIFVVLSIFFVAARLFANWKYSKKILIDDCTLYLTSTHQRGLPSSLHSDISVAAVLFLVAISVLSDEAGDGFHGTRPPYLVAQLATSLAIFTPPCLWACKAPILFLYLRLFGIKKWLAFGSYATLGVMAAAYIAGLVAIPPACTPRTHALTEEFIDACQLRTRQINVYLGAVSVLADLVILLLPLPVVINLSLVVRSKIGLILVFLSGFLAIIASAVSLYYKILSLMVSSTSLAAAMLATVSECSIALMVGCVPALRVMWSKILKPTRSTAYDYHTGTGPTGNRTNRNTSHYIVVREDVTITGERVSRQPSESSAELIIPKDVYSPHSSRPINGRAQNGPKPFGVFSEAYALDTREDGAWK